MKGKKAVLQGITCGILLSGMQWVMAAEKTVEVYRLTTEAATHGLGEKIGTVTFEDSEKGLLIKPDLKGLPKGNHGFHIHENPSCEGAEKEGKYQAGMAAGGHLDPTHSGKHLGPSGPGHLGDLPVLKVNGKGEAKNPVVAPHLTLEKIEGHSVMIHQGGDNYADKPPMGGGGDRIACGVIK